MKWGTVFSSTSFPDPQRAVALAEIAEEAGFESLWAPEHIVVPIYYAHLYDASQDGTLDRLGSTNGVPDPLIWFSFVASRTRTIKFGTGVMLLTERNVVHTAKEAATLDFLSGGRLMLGVGSGWCKEEYDALGVSWPNRGKRLDEYIGALRTLWTEEQASYKGQFVSFEPVDCRPKPVNGVVPLIIGGTSAGALKRAGQLGDGFFPAYFPTERVYEELPRDLKVVRDAARAAGRDPDKIEITSGGVRTAEKARWFADQGVSRLTIAVRSKTIPEMRDELMRFGDEVIQKTLTL
jgi:probable F420-dependent oxidoreductase